MGLWGRLLDVDLSTGRIRDYDVPEAWQRKYLGGRGIAARVLLEEDAHEADPLGPSNVWVQMTGPLTGHDLAGSGRHVTVARSPLTGFYAEAFAGGYYGTELARTGYDGLIVRGAADEPVHLWIDDGDAEILDAEDLWGLRTDETTGALEDRHGEDVEVACIGEAGEHEVRFAAVINDRSRAAARCGVGAVMGAKRLKAVACRGTKKREPAEADAFREALRGYVQTLVTDDYQAFGKYGTSGGLMSLNETNKLPTRNFRRGRIDTDDAEEISGETMYETILTGRETCTSCPVRCKREVQADVDGEQVDPDLGGPEYETLAAFGSFQGGHDLKRIALANQKCNQHGLDTISTGNVIAWAMEAAEEGVLDDGPAWGDARAAVELVEEIARREGLGDLLAEGVARASRKVGGQAYAMHVKGMEVPMHEPRGKKGLGVSYATSPRGATHMEGFHDTMVAGEAAPDLGIETTADPYGEDKARLVKRFEDARSFVNSLVMCSFDVETTGEDPNLRAVRRLVSAATGYGVDREGMLAIGERNYNLGRLFAVRCGLDPDVHDTLPRRLTEESLEYGDRRESMGGIDAMVEGYYDERGWPGGVPAPATLDRLGIEVTA